MNNKYVGLSRQIKQAVTMTEIASKYISEPNRAGFICCPFHDEKTPSLKVYPKNKGWHCFGCNAGGDIINFVSEYFGLGFVDACKKINSDFNLGIINNEGEYNDLAAQQAEIQREHERGKRKLEQARIWAEWGRQLTEYLRLRNLADKAKEYHHIDALPEDIVEGIKGVDIAEYYLDLLEEELNINNIKGGKLKWQ